MIRDEELTSERITVSDSPEALYRLALARHWTDGLPIVPPTPELVIEMLRYADRKPSEIIGEIPPKYGVATVEKMAINSVMAGCHPSYFPIILTAIEALLAPQFNLYGVQATTHPCGVLLIVNGPVAQELNINSGYNVFGQGWRANATIGRAVRLILMNVGGGVPGRLDRATFGQPGKFSFCIAENEDASPWEPFHVSRGFESSTSTVTVYAGDAPQDVNDHDSTSAEALLMTAAKTMAVPGAGHYWALGGEPVLVLGPEHAEVLARDGFDRRHIREYLYQHARCPLSAFSKEKAIGLIRRGLGGEPGDYSPNMPVPMVRSPEKFLILVAGGSGKHSASILGFGATQAVTRPVVDRTGRPVSSVEELKG